MNMPTNAIQPYDSAALADLILRSSDHVDFYVLGAFLRYVSPTFRTMFALNTGQAIEDNEKKDGHPVVSVAEDSNTLRLLLDSIYPSSEERSLDDVGLFWKAAKASQKYCMKIIEDKLRKRICASDLMKNNALSVYAVATDLGWDDVAIAAARQTLETPLESLAYVDELKSITGVGFYRFLEYRFRCSKSSDPKAEEFTEFKSVAQPCSPVDTDNVSDASAPFDSSAPADFVLRSSNLVDFFVSGTLIRRLSAVFKDMFPLPPDHEVKDAMPIVRVEESSEVLHCLLSVIHYDLDEPDIKECHLYIKVVLAARKYRMTTIERRLRKQAPNSPLTNSDPLRIYIIATSLGWEELAKTVALNTFSQPLDKLAYVDELCFISGADLYRLVKYRSRCVFVASSALESDPMFPKYGFGQWNRHFKSNTSMSIWGTKYDPTNPSSAYTQLKVSPRGSTVSDIYSKHLELVASDSSGKFSISPRRLFNIVRCARDAEKSVESAVAKVEFVKGEFFPKTPWRSREGNLPG
ncbi:hypothetical protein M378DRAFT_157432 [Amanita muscaria Koide BX008]|uniref:BTB domain-containing protein n=1 Tax=Amanita muscaria (strain Koide BX008) TaxID=946122 RepID=A0A0C2X4L1_AMAMK|nr:hypothetical protein M378DRAFT_157432 [Amanita muscaria Koide BX008]